jgi:mannosyltransferase OCH1-like enzyme
MKLFYILIWKKIKLFIRYNLYYQIKYFPLKLFKKKIFRYSLKNLKAKIKIKQNINTIVHQTWVENKFNKKHYLELLKFRKINPELSFKLYNNKQMDNYIKNNWSKHKISEVYNQLIYGPMKSDIFRYCILYDKGGYYFDIDKMCLKPLTSLHDKNASALITFEPYHYKKVNNNNVAKFMRISNKQACQWGMGFQKKSQILLELIENICKYYKKYNNKYVKEYVIEGTKFTGPGIFTDTIRNFLKKKIDKKICFLKTNFDGHGIFRMKGSNLRYIWSRPAWTFKNIKLLKH